MNDFQRPRWNRTFVECDGALAGRLQWRLFMENRSRHPNGQCPLAVNPSRF
ncbi:MAG: hypothetical protein PHE53_01235 [Thermoguttaceae bacterium]|nr:hypothetical protein [Thermoguttaceae bacterium]